MLCAVGSQLCGHTDMRALVLLFALASALYEEPPGGCQGPPDDFEPIPFNPSGPKAIRRPPRPPPPQAPPSTKTPVPSADEAEEESQAELQRQAYEQASAERRDGDGQG